MILFSDSNLETMWNGNIYSESEKYVHRIICPWHKLLTNHVMLWLVRSFEATESVGGAKHDWPVCPGQPAASVASRQAHRSWETRGLRWAIAYAFYKAHFFSFLFYFIFTKIIAHIYYASCCYCFFFCNSLAIYLTFEHTLITFYFDNIYTQFIHIIIYLVGIKILYSFILTRTR